MSNSLDPDQARRIVGPDLGPNCLPRLSADDTSRQRVNIDRSMHLCLQLGKFLVKCIELIDLPNGLPPCQIAVRSCHFFGLICCFMSMVNS